MMEFYIDLRIAILHYPQAPSEREIEVIRTCWRRIPSSITTPIREHHEYELFSRRPLIKNGRNDCQKDSRGIDCMSRFQESRHAKHFTDHGNDALDLNEPPDSRLDRCIHNSAYHQSESCISHALPFSLLQLILIARQRWPIDGLIRSINSID